MCLKSVSRKHFFQGYKVGKIEDGKFIAFQSRTELDNWQVAETKELGCYMDFATKYLSGFHVCPDLDVAKEYLEYIRRSNSRMYADWKIFPCEYSGVMYRGVDESGIKTVIAALININSIPVE